MALAQASALGRIVEVNERAAVFYRRCRTYFLTLIVSSLSVWLIFNWAQTVRRVISYYDPLPAWDYWRVPYDLYFYKSLGLQIFLHFHNAMNAVFILLIIVGTVKLRSGLENSEQDFANRQFAALRIENGLRASGITARMFPDPPLVFLLLPYLKDHQLSIYSLPVGRLLGQPASALGPLQTAPWPGEISYTFPVESGIQVVGWAEPERGGSEQIVFLNEQREIVGIGRNSPPVSPLICERPETSS